MGRHNALSLAVALSLVLAGCSGGSNTLDSVGTSPPPPTPGTSDSGCAGQCANANSFLTADDVRKIIAQAVNEAKAQNSPATIVVSDRVGNVLAAYRMAGAPPTQKVSSQRGLVGGLEGLDIPAEFGAISKALTAVYFSSEGNAFTSRTAGQIVQEHFNPGDGTAPSGPLFGVQIANLPCSDINVPFNGTGPSPGPHPAPVGLAADPGGISLYNPGCRSAQSASPPTRSTASTPTPSTATRTSTRSSPSPAATASPDPPTGAPTRSPPAACSCATPIPSSTNWRAIRPRRRRSPR